MPDAVAAACGQLEEPHELEILQGKLFEVELGINNLRAAARTWLLLEQARGGTQTVDNLQLRMAGVSVSLKQLPDQAAAVVLDAFQADAAGKVLVAMGGFEAAAEQALQFLRKTREEAYAGQAQPPACDKSVASDDRSVASDDKFGALFEIDEELPI